MAVSFEKGFTAYGMNECLAEYRLVDNSISSNKWKVAKKRGLSTGDRTASFHQSHMVFCSICKNAVKKDYSRRQREKVMKVETKEAIIHVIVATAEWGKDKLRYRRHRLAEFLAAQEETKEVIWVCPAPRPKEMNFSKFIQASGNLLSKTCWRKNVSFRTIYRCLLQA